MSSKRSIFYLSLIFITLLACENKPKREKTSTSKSTTFELLDSTRTGVTFLNQVENKDKFNIFSYRNFYNGGGVGIIDINNDGLQDIVFTGNQVNNKLYLNKGDFQFEDITETAGLKGYGGWSTGVLTKTVLKIFILVMRVMKRIATHSMNYSSIMVIIPLRRRLQNTDLMNPVIQPMQHFSIMTEMAI